MTELMSETIAKSRGSAEVYSIDGDIVGTQTLSGHQLKTSRNISDRNAITIIALNFAHSEDLSLREVTDFPFSCRDIA